MSLTRSLISANLPSSTPIRPKPHFSVSIRELALTGEAVEKGWPARVTGQSEAGRAIGLTR